MSVEAVGEVAIVPAVAVRFAMVPSEVSEDAVTPLASVDPLRVPAGATTAAVEIDVVSPFALMVMIGISVLLPVEPGVAGLDAGLEKAAGLAGLLAETRRDPVVAGLIVAGGVGREVQRRVGAWPVQSRPGPVHDDGRCAQLPGHGIHQGCGDPRPPSPNPIGARAEAP